MALIHYHQLNSRPDSDVIMSPWMSLYFWAHTSTPATHSGVMCPVWPGVVSLFFLVTHDLNGLCKQVLAKYLPAACHVLVSQCCFPHGAAWRCPLLGREGRASSTDAALCVGQQKFTFCRLFCRTTKLVTLKKTISWPDNLFVWIILKMYKHTSIRKKPFTEKANRL